MVSLRGISLGGSNAKLEVAIGSGSDTPVMTFTSHAAIGPVEQVSIKALDLGGNYALPTSAGTSGQTLQLGPDNYSLNWVSGDTTAPTFSNTFGSFIEQNGVSGYAIELNDTYDGKTIFLHSNDTTNEDAPIFFAVGNLTKSIAFYMRIAFDIIGGGAPGVLPPNYSILYAQTLIGGGAASPDNGVATATNGIMYLCGWDNNAKKFAVY
jgi:hypothetical protein